jgi:anti-sigma factor RsiW
MNVTDDVLNDLLTLYLAGEASADTRALIEDRARREPAFADRLAAARAVDLAAALPATPPDDLELQALARTRQTLFLRHLFWWSGLFFTVLPLLFHADGDGVEFLIIGRYPGLMWAFWSVAAAAWVAYYVIDRQVRPTGL